MSDGVVVEEAGKSAKDMVTEVRKLYQSKHAATAGEPSYALEPLCVHSNVKGHLWWRRRVIEPASVCAICMNDPELREWRQGWVAWFLEHPDDPRNPRNPTGRSAGSAANRRYFSRALPQWYPPEVRARIAAIKDTAAMSWLNAERVCREWMQEHGYRDARLTENGAGGGIDIVSDEAVAQIEHQTKPAGISEIQRLYGIAQATKKEALFFSTMGYTDSARKWATTHGVVCYRFLPFRQVL